MNENFTYGFAAVGPSDSYPRFGEGLKLDHIPADFVLPEQVGAHLMRFLDSPEKTWRREATGSEALIIDGLMDCYTEPDLKAVNTYTSEKRAVLHGDGVVMVSTTRCQIASAAVVHELLDAVNTKEIPAVLSDWLQGHRLMVSATGGVVITRLGTFESCHITEMRSKKSTGLKIYLDLSCQPSARTSA